MGLLESGGSCENPQMPIVIGIDGGGTKTTCAVSRDGQLLASVKTGASNLVRVSDEEAKTSVQSAIKSACQSAGVALEDVEAACVGAGGASREQTSARMHDIVAELISGPIEIVGDMVVAHEAAMRGGAGVIIIAGTGSIAYGRNERGETARAGGWGPVISDEGSGSWIGRNAVAAAFRALDCGRSTVLIRHIMDRWKVITRDDLIQTANGNPQPNFSLLAPSVFQAAGEGDIVAQELLTDAGSELAKLTKVVVRRLWPGQHDIQIAALGGIFTNSKFVYKVFENSVRSERARASVRLMTDDPVMGAVFRAERLLESGPGEDEP